MEVDVAQIVVAGGRCGGDGGEDGDREGVWLLPAELWAMVCKSLSTDDLARLSVTCWTLRSHALSRVRHHKAFCQALVMPPSKIRKILRFLATFPALVSLDLSEWSDFLDDFTVEYPPSLEKLVVCWTSFGDRALRRLPPSLKELDVSHTMVTGAGLRALARLTSLRELNMAGICALSADHLHFLPPSIETLDMSACQGPITTQLTKLRTTVGNTLAVPWPPALRELKVCGYELSLAQLYRMPATLESLDLSYCFLRPCEVDFDACLPRLVSLHVNHVTHNYDYSTVSLPASLESLSLRAHPRAHTFLQFAPASLTFLDIEGAHFPALPDYREFVRYMTSLPHKPHLSYYTHPRGYFHRDDDNDDEETMIMQMTTTTKREFRPREEDPQWHAFIQQCPARLQTSVTWLAVPVPPVDDGEAEVKLEEDNDDDDGEDDGGEDGQGSLLFWN